MPLSKGNGESWVVQEGISDESSLSSLWKGEV